MSSPEQPASSPTEQLLTAAANMQHATDNIRAAGDALRTTAGHVAQLNQMTAEHLASTPEQPTTNP